MSGTMDFETAQRLMEELGDLAAKYGVRMGACSCCTGFTIDTERHADGVLARVWVSADGSYSAGFDPDGNDYRADSPSSPKIERDRS